MAFWREALHYVDREPPPSGWVVLCDPTGKRPVTKRKCVVGPARATRYPWRYQPDNDFVALADPDDSLFCVVQKAGGLF